MYLNNMLAAKGIDASHRGRQEDPAEIMGVIEIVLTDERTRR
jgi:hypothetical protein